MVFFFATTNLSKGHCHQIYLQQWKQKKKNNFSHMFSLLQVLTKKEQDISNHSYTALKKMACLLEVVNYIAFLFEYDLKFLVWHLKSGELVSKPPAEYFLRPGFFYQSLKLISFGMSLINPLSPLPKGLHPKYNNYILPRPLGSGTGDLLI